MKQSTAVDGVKNLRPALSSGYWSELRRSIWRSRHIYMLLLPGLVWFAVFAYLPMGGLTLAFREFRGNLGIWRSPWVGLQIFEYVWRDPRFFASIQTTLVINITRLVVQFPFPIFLALVLNEVRLGRMKKVFQTIFTFPNFLGWIVISSVLLNFLGGAGFVNSTLNMMGFESFNFLGNASIFRPLLYITAMWAHSGWGAIIYLAAIAGIDTEQYEAAEIDGASRLQRMRYVTLPGLSSTIIVMFILACGGLMTAGFDQIFNLSNPAVISVAETIDMYIYRITFMAAADFSFSTAVALVRSILNLMFLLVCNLIVKKLFGQGLFA